MPWIEELPTQPISKTFTNTNKPKYNSLGCLIYLSIQRPVFGKSKLRYSYSIQKNQGELVSPLPLVLFFFWYMPQIVIEILLQFDTTCPDSRLTVDGLILTVDGFLQNLGCRRELSGFAGETQQTHKRPKELSVNNLNILRPSSSRLWPILNHKILNIALLCLRFCSIGSAKFNPNPSTILSNLFADNSKVIATDKGCDAKDFCQQLRKRGISLVLRT